MATHILTDITLQFQHATSGWHAYLYPIAKHLFSMLAMIEIAWAGIWWTLTKNDADSLIIEFLQKTFYIGIFYTILSKSDTWIPNIINSFMKIGSGASGHSQLFPSDVLDQGVSIASNIFHVFHNQGIMSMGIATIVGAFVGLFVVFAFACIAGLLVYALVESYIVLGAGILYLGFAANRMSNRFAINYFSYAMSIGTKLFVLYLILGVGGSLANNWIETFLNMKEVDITPFLEVFGASLVYAIIAWQIPAKAEALMAGASSASLGGIIAGASAVKSAGSAVSGAIASTARGAISAGTSGFEAVKQAAAIGQGMGGGIAGYAAGAAAAGLNVVTSVAGSAVGHYSSAGRAMQGKTNSINHYFANKAETNAANKNNERPTKTSPPSERANENKSSVSSATQNYPTSETSGQIAAKPTSDANKETSSPTNTSKKYE